MGVGVAVGVGVGLEVGVGIGMTVGVGVGTTVGVATDRVQAASSSTPATTKTTCFQGYRMSGSLAEGV